MASVPEFPRPELPRLNFSGRFFTDPSTVNNDIRHYDVANFRPNFQLLQEGELPEDEDNPRPDEHWVANGRWNPGGNSSFAFIDCQVKSVNTVNEVVHEDDYVDPLIGRLIVGNRHSVYGKISDLDPQNQGISHLYGVRVNLRCSDDSGHLSAVLKPCSQRDPWVSADKYDVTVQNISAVYQGVLAVESFKPGNSQFFKECEEYIEKSRTARDHDGNILFPNGALTIRFRLSDYDITPSQKETFRYGRCVGHITPWLPGYPLRFDAGRVLRVPGGENTRRSNAYAHLQRCTDGSSDYSLYVDLVNSLERTSLSNYKDIGNLYLAFIPSGPRQRIKAPYQVIANGEINYRADNWENETGCVFEVKIRPILRRIIENRQLAIVAIKNGVGKILLAEPTDGLFPRADIYGVRVNPGETVNVDFYLSRFGRRVPHGVIKIGFDSTGLVGTGISRQGGPTPGYPIKALSIAGTTPSNEDADEFEVSVQTDDNGFVRVPIVGGDCGNPRKYVDGQIYGLRYAASFYLPELNPRAPASEKVTVKLFDVFTPPETPSWIVDIYPIFKLYANLYPGMDRVVSLDDFGSVVEKRDALYRAFSVSEEDPRYMPVTRDLSKAKKGMILKWIKRNPGNPKEEPLYMNIHRKQDLYTALQTVIELEHATMPPYLTALYSIKQGTNQYIADTLRDVAIEEMLHFAIAANILTAIGGKPQINKPNFVPKFPGPLPGGLRRGLIVGLSKCTILQLKAFMALEAPDTQHLPDDDEVKNNSGNSLQENKYTIAFLYDYILQSLKELRKDPSDCSEDPEAIYFPKDLGLREDDGDPRVSYQVTGAFGKELFKILDIEDAEKGIEIIKEQGEGASPSEPNESSIDPDTGLPTLAHFFRFAEIVKGRRLLFKDGGFSYEGPKIELNEAGIYNMRSNPKVETLPKGSLARERMESFSRKYQGLLNALHRTFNGEPDYLKEALACMHQLTMDAKPLMEMPMINFDGTPSNDGTTVGISFQLPFKGDEA